MADYKARPVIQATILCPSCNSRLTGYIGENRYFCRECYTEFTTAKKNATIYKLTYDGNAVKMANKETEKSFLHGIRYREDRKKWIVSICHHCKRDYVGAYNTVEEAVQAYNKRAIEVLGVNANLNIIGG